MSKTANVPASDPSPGASAALPRQASVDTSKLSSNYINFCRVTGMPEELIIDFGLSTDPVEMNQGTVLATERVILSFFTGKRLLDALQLTISRHEAAFGKLEVNVDKRVAPGWRG